MNQSIYYTIQIFLKKHLFKTKNSGKDELLQEFVGLEHHVLCMAAQLKVVVHGPMTICCEFPEKKETIVQFKNHGLSLSKKSTICVHVCVLF